MAFPFTWSLTSPAPATDRVSQFPSVTFYWGDKTTLRDIIPLTDRGTGATLGWRTQQYGNVIWTMWNASSTDGVTFNRDDTAARAFAQRRNADGTVDLLDAPIAANPITWAVIFKYSGSGPFLTVGTLVGTDPTNPGTVRLRQGVTALDAFGGLEFEPVANSGWKIEGVDLLLGNVPLVFLSRAAAAAWTERMRISQAGLLSLVNGINLTAGAAARIGTTDAFDLILKAAGFDVLEVSGDGASVNHFRIVSRPTGLGPDLSVVGTDANIDLRLNPKGTGKVSVLQNPLLLAVDPVAALDAATKQYVDSLSIFKASNLAASSAAVTITAALVTVVTLDMGTVVVGDIIIVTAFYEAVKGAASGHTNFYILKDSGTASIVMGSVGDRYSSGSNQGNATTVRDSFGGLIRVTGAGTLVLKLSGESIGSDSTVAADNAALRAVILKP